MKEGKTVWLPSDIWNKLNKQSFAHNVARSDIVERAVVFMFQVEDALLLEDGRQELNLVLREIEASMNE